MEIQINIYYLIMNYLNEQLIFAYPKSSINKDSQIQQSKHIIT